MKSTRLRQLQGRGEANTKLACGLFHLHKWPQHNSGGGRQWWDGTVGPLRNLIPGREENAWFGKAPHSFTRLSPHLTFQLTTVLEIQGNIF